MEWETVDYFMYETLPEDLTIVHAWMRVPLLEREHEVGHMALQTRDYYLSVWPLRIRATQKKVLSFL